MKQDVVLPPLQNNVFEALRQKVGEVVSYAELDKVISCKRDRNLLAASIYRLRKRGLKIKNHSGVGYRLIQRRKPVEVIDLEDQDAVYANEMTDAIHSVMRRHAEAVGFESQMAIMGVAIGAILYQLTARERNHFTRVFLKNMREAERFSQVIQFH